MGEGAKLIIVGGLPGSGKTTLARLLERQLDATRLCPDEVLEEREVNLWDAWARQTVEDEQWEQAKNLLGEGRTVIIEWGTWARSERDNLREYARSIGIPVELRWMEAPIDDLWKRIKRRDREDPPVTREHLSEWAQLVQTPTPDERSLFDPPAGVR